MPKHSFREGNGWLTLFQCRIARYEKSERLSADNDLARGVCTAPACFYANVWQDRR
jgi:hypothetical protein